MAAIAGANRGSINLDSFPSVALADGRTRITITATIRTFGGRVVPDGTQVVFSSALGTLTEPVVTTVSGIARTQLIAPNVAGAVRINASALSVDASAHLDLEFVTDRAVVDSSRNYIELVAPKSLMYSSEYQAMTASDTEGRVALRFRDISIDAQDLQLALTTQEVRARNAVLRLSGKEYRFDQLFFRLNARRGVGLTEVTEPVYSVVATPPYFGFEQRERRRLAPVEVRASGIQPVTEPLSATQFDFMELSNAAVFVAARRAVVVPGRSIQFTKAEVSIDGMRVLSSTLFQVSLNAATPMITDQFFQVSGTELAVDYPYYLTLKPGGSSLIRFRSGTRYGNAVGAASGTFLDYEMRWNQGDRSEGGITLSGMNRGDYAVGVRQFHRLDDRTTVNAQVDMPAGRSLFSSGGVAHQFGGGLEGWSANLNVNYGTSLRGSQFRNDQLDVSIDRDPVQLGKLPLRLNYGISASQNRFSANDFSSSSQRLAARSRLQLTPQSLGKGSTLSASMTAGHVISNIRPGSFTFGASTAIFSSFGRDLRTSVSYDFLDDPQFSSLLGRHRVGFQAGYSPRRFRLSVQGNRSLDVDQQSLGGEASYWLGPDWRLGYSLIADRYRGRSSTDWNLIFGYRVGYREIGISYSARTNRIGIELLSARF